MDFTEVCRNIRSCLNSSKSQLSVTQLNRDYNEVLGENIPYRKVGYSSLEALIRAVPNIRISSIRGELFIDVKPDEKTAHIASLVREQRTGKKKKKKSSRGGLYRGSIAPPRRPVSMPSAPPRRSAPPSSYQSDYKRNVSSDYNNRRRDSPPEQSYQSQRRPNPSYQSDSQYSRQRDSQKSTDNYYSRRRDPSPTPPSSGNYYSSRRRDPSPPRQSSYSNHRNSDTIEISSDEDTRIENITRKYRSHPSQYDFSDPNEFDDDDCSDFDDCDEINNKMEELKVTLGKQRQVSINKPAYRSYPSNNSNDDDYGYSSMNEINAATSEPQPSGDASSKGKGDSISKMNVARGPAALLAAGRAMKEEPNLKSTRAPTRTPEIRPTTVTMPSTKVRLDEPKSTTYQPPMHNFIKQYLSKNSHTHGDSTEPRILATVPLTPREPFKTMQTQPINNGRSSVTARLERSSSTTSQPERPSPTTSPISETRPTSKNIGSKMSASNMFRPGPQVKPDFETDVYCRKLQEFAMKRNLHTPTFKNFVKFCPRTKAATYMCKIKMGPSLNFTSCPYESNLIKDVYEYTAKIALEELQKTPDSTALPVTTDENLIIKRIAEIVNPHSTGLKSDTIESKYQLMHQEILPIDWLDIVKNRSLLSVEELIGGTTAVYPVEGGINTHLDVSKLPPLVLPENEVWNVYVTCCVSTSCLYFRIIHDDYNGLYAVMDEKMFELYESKREADELRSVEMVKEGSYYAAYLDNAWFRVKALSSIVDGVVRVCLIDHGDVDEIEKEDLFNLDERFTNLPAQKVSCCLTGLESYSNEPYVTRMVADSTCGKAFVARVDTRNPNLQLTLLDTSTDSDIDVNQLLIERIEKELQPPKLPPLGNVTDTYLISVKEDGMAYVQIYSESFKLLKSFLDEASEELASNFEKYRVTSSTELLGSKIFLARYAADGKWYRVIIDRVVSDELIEVLFVDYGNLDVVTLNDIADVDQFTEVLSIMPNQAVQVKLVKPSEELFTEKVLQFLMDLSVPKDSSEPTRFLMKTVREGAIPDVHLFFRLPDTNQLVNVNDLIGSYFPDQRGPNHIEIPLSTVKSMSTTIANINMVKESKKVATSTPKETLDRLYPIPQYEVPINEQFSVYVTMVSSPSNFIVQPQADSSELSKLKEEMNEFYAKEEPFVDVSNIKEDEAYAVKNDSDGKWYRGIVIKLMNRLESITVRLVDYGDIVTITHSNIAQLLPCFRTLPRQAIKAELAGVTPLHSDWSVDDCLRFKRLVSEKLLISIVVEVLETGKISVILCDTSVTPAIDIGTVLVHEGRAKDITAC